jgi:hypothetical protein
LRRSQSTPDRAASGPTAERERVGGGEEADSLRALEPDLVAVEQRLVVVHRPRHVAREVPRLLVEAFGDVLGEPADLEVAGVHADAR